MYMPGRLRTGSRPSRTVIEEASYPLWGGPVGAAFLRLFFGLFRHVSYLKYSINRYIFPVFFMTLGVYKRRPPLRCRRGGFRSHYHVVVEKDTTSSPTPYSNPGFPFGRISRTRMGA